MVELSARGSIAECLEEAAYTVGAVGIRVRASRAGLLRDLDVLYPVRRSGRVGDEPLVTMEVRCTRRSWLGRDCFRAFGDAEPFGPEVPARQVLPYLEWGVNHELVRRCDRFLPIHAAAVALSGRGVLMPASSGSGKSTLAMGLVARGWTYLTDEVALMDRHTMLCHPFPKALCLKSGSFALAGRAGFPMAAGPYRVKGTKGVVGYVSPASSFPDRIGGVVPIRFMIFPKYAPESMPRLRRLRAAEAAFALAGNMMNRTRFGAEAVECAARIAGGAECFALDVGAIDRTAELLEAAVSA